MSKKKKLSRSAPELIQLGLNDTGASKRLSDEVGSGKRTAAPGRGLIVLAFMILSMTVMGAMAVFREYSPIPTSLYAVPVPTPPTMPGSSPSREYIYAGSQLLASQNPSVPSISVSGFVKNGSGSPINNVTVSLINPQGVTFTSVTGTTGAYQFYDVPTGVTYTLTANSRSYRFYSQQVSVTASMSDIVLVGLE